MIEIVQFCMFMYCVFTLFYIFLNSHIYSSGILLYSSSAIHPPVNLNALVSPSQKLTVTVDLFDLGNEIMCQSVEICTLLAWRFLNREAEFV